MCALLQCSTVLIILFQFSPTILVHWWNRSMLCAVIIIKTVVFKIQNNWAVKVADTPAKWALVICDFWTDSPPVHRLLVLTTAENNFWYTYVQTREYRQQRQQQQKINIALFVFPLYLTKITLTLLIMGVHTIFFFFLNSKLSSEEELRHLGRFWSNSTMLNWFVRSLKIIHILWRCSYLVSVSASSLGVFPLLEMDDAQSQLLWQSNSSLSNRRGRFG